MIAERDQEQLERAQDLVGAYLGRSHSLIVHRGTTAIHLALRVIERRFGRGDVILPTMACAAIAQVVHSAGFRPVFADVGLPDCTIDVQSIRECMTPATRAILAVHLFGHAADMHAITALAAEHGCCVIEDAAQAVGGSCDGRKLGSMGDFSILSFGGDKIISAGGGGAITTDNGEYARLLREEIALLPEAMSGITRDLKSLSHRNLYHALVDLLRVDGHAQVNQVFMDAISFYDDLYVGQFTSDRNVIDRIAESFAGLDSLNERRLANAARYASLLVSDALILSDAWKRSGVVWRYSFLVRSPEAALRMTADLRRAGIRVSNHYWSMADLFYNEKWQRNTAYICPRIINLWVDATVTELEVERSCELILRGLGSRA